MLVGIGILHGPRDYSIVQRPQKSPDAKSMCMNWPAGALPGLPMI